MNQNTQYTGYPQPPAGGDTVPPVQTAETYAVPPQPAYQPVPPVQTAETYAVPPQPAYQPVPPVPYQPIPYGNVPVMQGVPAGYIPQAYGFVPPWADPVKLEQKEMRKASSRLSWAIFASLPLSTVVSLLAMLFFSLCGVDIYLPEGEGVSGMPGVAYYLLAGATTFLTIALPFALFLIIGKRRIEDTILTQKTGFLTGILLAFAGLFICIVMNIPAGWISMLLEELGLNGAVNTDAMTVNSIWDILTLVLAVVLIAPVAEEFAFRGVTVAVLRRWGDWPAVIFSAVIFGFAHYSFQALPVVLMGGFVMALLYVWTKNIWINIFVHFLNNLVATLPIIAEYYWGEDVSVAFSEISMLVVFALGILSIILLLVLHFTGRRRLDFTMQKGTPIPKKGMQLFVNAGFISFFVSFIIMAVVSLYAI